VDASESLSYLGGSARPPFFPSPPALESSSRLGDDLQNEGLAPHPKEDGEDGHALTEEGHPHSEECDGDWCLRARAEGLLRGEQPLVLLLRRRRRLRGPLAVGAAAVPILASTGLQLVFGLALGLGLGSGLALGLSLSLGLGLEYNLIYTNQIVKQLDL